MHGDQRPGATNLITGIATAYMDSIPMVAITGQVPSNLLGRDIFQEVDITGAVAPFSKHSYLVKDANDIPRVVKEAFHIASTGRPGPVLIDIPIDVQEQTLKKFQYPETVNIRGYKPSVKGNDLQIKRVVEAIARAKQPLICAGGGVWLANARDELLELAESCAIPVVKTMMGISLMATDHPLNMGMIGAHGNHCANQRWPRRICSSWWAPGPPTGPWWTPRRSSGAWPPFTSTWTRRKSARTWRPPSPWWAT